MIDVIVFALPDEAEVADLQSFVKGLANKGIFRIKEMRYANGSRLRYGLISFEQPKHATKAIKKFNQKKLLGEPVTVRQYVHRSYQNERRALNWRDIPWRGPDRRKIERRKNLLRAGSEGVDSLSGILAVETARGTVLKSS